MLLISHNSRKRKKEAKPSHNEELFSKLTLQENWTMVILQPLLCKDISHLPSNSCKSHPCVNRLSMLRSKNIHGETDFLKAVSHQLNKSNGRSYFKVNPMFQKQHFLMKSKTKTFNNEDSSNYFSTELWCTQRYTISFAIEMQLQNCVQQQKPILL